MAAAPHRAASKQGNDSGENVPITVNHRRRPAWILIAITSAWLTSLTSCTVDARYQPAPKPVAIKASDIAGKWKGAHGAWIRFSADGHLKAERLQPQETQSDSPDTATGSGEWKIIESRNYKGGMTTAQSGRLLKMSLTRTKSKSRSSGSSTDFSSPQDAPPLPDTHSSQRRTWVVSPATDTKGLYLYYLVGDPDVRQKFTLRKSGKS